MLEIEEIITLENEQDYVVSQIVNENKSNYYLLMKLEGEEVTDEFLIVKENDQSSFEVITEEEFDVIKPKFVQLLLDK